MATAKARSAEPVRGYHQTTIHSGRVVQASNKGFGLARLGGLINAQIEGLSTPSTGGNRLKTPKEAVNLAGLHGPEADKNRLESHRTWKQESVQTYKENDEQAKKAEQIQEEVAKKFEEEKGKPKSTPKVELVEGRPTAVDNADPFVMDDPKHLAEAEDKTVVQQKEENLEGAGDQAHKAGDKPRPDVAKAEGQPAPAEQKKGEKK